MSELGLEGWGEYKKLILKELERLEAAVNELNRKIDAFRADDMATLKVEIALLKLKAGVWGAVAGAVPVSAMVLWYLLTK